MSARCKASRRHGEHLGGSAFWACLMCVRCLHLFSIFTEDDAVMSTRKANLSSTRTYYPIGGGSSGQWYIVPNGVRPACHLAPGRLRISGVSASASPRLTGITSIQGRARAQIWMLTLVLMCFGCMVTFWHLKRVDPFAAQDFEGTCAIFLPLVMELFFQHIERDDHKSSSK